MAVCDTCQKHIEAKGESVVRIGLRRGIFAYFCNHDCYMSAIEG